MSPPGAFSHHCRRCQVRHIPRDRPNLNFRKPMQNRRQASPRLADVPRVHGSRKTRRAAGERGPYMRFLLRCCLHEAVWDQSFAYTLKPWWSSVLFRQAWAEFYHPTVTSEVTPSEISKGRGAGPSIHEKGVLPGIERKRTSFGNLKTSSKDMPRRRIRGRACRALDRDAV